MKTKWKFLLPDWSELDTLWHNSKPFCLWPIGNRSLIVHWMDHAVKNSIDQIEFYTSDRPSMVRDTIGDGTYWSCDVSIIPLQSDEKAPEDAIPLIGLPTSNRFNAPLDQANDLLKHWQDLNRQWLENICEYSLKIEFKHASGGWIGPQTRIHPEATLEPPFWIQGPCDIGAGATIGPNTCIGENAIIDQGASLSDSIVLPGTVVGRNTSLDRVAVDGGLLLDIKRGCRVPITDSFILSGLGKSIKSTSLFERCLALILFILIAPLVALRRSDWSSFEAHDGNGGFLKLKTGSQGSLIQRRFHWLKEVIKGRMKLIGILPRPADWTIEDNSEVEKRLIDTLPGVISLSDYHDCHSPDNPDEWIHASYQALEADRKLNKLIRNRFWKIAFKKAS